MASKKQIELDAKLLCELLEYDPKTGFLTWKSRRQKHFKNIRSMNIWNTKYAGQEAFVTKCNKGYKRGSLLGRRLLAHRVIWCMVTGAWPSQFIDHINGDPSDNCFSNLREASASENMRNMAAHKNSSSRFHGVSRHKRTGTWRATIYHDGKHHHLGHFHDEERAARAYDRSAAKLFGEFARLNFSRVSGCSQ